MKRTALLFIIVLGVMSACSDQDETSTDSIDIGAAAVDGTMQLETDRYSVNLRIPNSANTMAESDVRTFLQSQLNELLESVREEPEPGYFSTHQYEFVSDWETAESDYLYTFIVRGHSYTGGAHNMPFVKTFTYSKADDSRVELEALLAGDDGLASIAAMASEHFETVLPSEMADTGLSPEWSNWQNWFVSNNRISFVFPVYQIASYADGEQQFSVMVEPDTRHLFNLDYFNVYEPEIRITDDQGHGPDPGSEEAARSAAWQLIKRSPAYIEDGHSLEITNIERRSNTQSDWMVNYTWQHHGDPEGNYSGQVHVVNDVPEFVERSVLPTDGSYAPNCMAYEGDEIDIEGGRFTWRRFTDQLEIDENGERVDPFPDYPKTGSTALDGLRLDLLADDGAVIAAFYLQSSANEHYLLTSEQNRQFVGDGTIADCALVRSAK